MMLLLEWEARIRCIKFWVKVLKMEDKRVIRIIGGMGRSWQSEVAGGFEVQLGEVWVVK